MNGQLVKRMNTIGKVGNIVTIVVIVLLIIGTVAVTAGAVVISALPSDTVEARINAQADISFKGEVFGSVGDDIVNGVNDGADGQKVASGDVSIAAEKVGKDAVLHVAAEGIRIKSGDFASVLWTAAVSCAAFVVCAFFFRLLMKELAKASTPFCDGVVRRMKRFAIVLLVCAGVTSICKTIIGSVLTMGHGFAASLDFGPIVAALIVFVLVVVFRYGAQLQKESDETL